MGNGHDNVINEKRISEKRSEAIIGVKAEIKPSFCIDIQAVACHLHGDGVFTSGIFPCSSRDGGDCLSYIGHVVLNLCQ